MLKFIKTRRSLQCELQMILKSFTYCYYFGPSSPHQAGSLRSLIHDDIYILEALFELFLFTLIQNDTCLSIPSILKYEDETKNGLPLQAFGVH